jgi:hypothetical protein
MTIFNAPALPPLPRPAVIRPAGQALLRPGAFRPVTHEERRVVIAELLRSKRLTRAEATVAMLFVPVAGWKHSSVATAPTVVSRSCYGDPSYGLSHSVPLPASLVSGNLLILVAGYSNGAAPAGAINTPSGWTKLDSITGANKAIEYIFYKTATGSEGATLTISSTNVSRGMGFLAYQIAGWSGTPQVGTFVTGTNNTPDPPSVTPTGAASLALALCGGDGDGNPQTISAYPSGYSNGQVGATTGTGSVLTGFAAGAEATISGTSPVDPGTFTLGYTPYENWWAQTVIVNAA